MKSVGVWRLDSKQVSKIAMITPFDKLMYYNKLDIINIRAFEEEKADPNSEEKVRIFNVFCTTQVSKVFAFKLMI